MVCLAACILSPPSGLAQSKVVAPGAALQRLADGFQFTEGPAADAEGNVFFTDQPNNRILRWAIAGRLTTFLQPCGRSNGLCFDREGNLWACADENNELWRIDPTGKATVVVKDYQGKLLNGPNDVWVRPDGGLYFTDPFYKRPYWKRGPKQQDGEHVYYLSPDRRSLRRVAEDLQQPNGIIGTPDGRTLYVADIAARKTYAYAILPDGALAEKRLFCSMGSDGMTIDDEGMVYDGQRIAFADMVSLRDYSPKGWIDLYYRVGEREKRLRLDNEKVLRFDEIVDALCKAKGFRNEVREYAEEKARQKAEEAAAAAAEDAERKDAGGNPT